MVDGRRLRRQQNRDAVIGALMDLFAEGVYEPKAEDIAERAGISTRSLFRYFDDVDDLARAAIGRQHELARPLLDPGVSADADTLSKIDAVVKGRIRLFEATAPAARAARFGAHRHPQVAAELHGFRSHQRDQLSTIFAIELAAGEADMLPALDALCSFETHELLRRDQGLSRAKTVAALSAAMRSLLGANSKERL